MPLLERVGRNVRLTAAAQAPRRPHRRAARAHGGGRGRPAGHGRADHRDGARGGDPVRRALPARARAAQAARPRIRRCAWRSPTPSPRPRCRALALGTLDLVLGDQYPFLPRAPDTGWTSSRCWRSASAWCCPPSTRWRREAGRCSLRRCATSHGRPARPTAHYGELTIRACRALGGFEPDVRHRSNDLLMLLALVANGQAVTLLPDLVRPGPRAVRPSPATSPRPR